MELSDIIQRGNIIRTAVPKDDAPGCYQAGGMFGCVWSAYGLHAPEMRQQRNLKEGRSHFVYMKHWGRFSFFSEALNTETVSDYILPLIRINWREEPEDVSGYRQEQNFWNGTVTTSFKEKSGGKTEVVAWFDPVEKQLSGMELTFEGKDAVVDIKPVSGFDPYPFLYKKSISQRMRAVKEKDGIRINISCDDTALPCSTDIYIYTDTEAEISENAVSLHFAEGKHTLFFSCGKRCSGDTRSASKERTADAWHRIWEKSPRINFKDDEAQMMYVRSLAYLCGTYGSEAGFIPPTNGFTGNMFPFHFVQDLAYIAPTLLSCGHTDIVRSWVEKFAGEIPQMREYARRLWKEAKGICPPWELPFGSIEGYHTPKPPVIYCYEPHNTAYLCRIATLAAEYIRDKAWEEKYVRPIVTECALFYSAFAKKGEDGLWHFKWYPSVGQDEAGGRNREDYLCSLYSAKFCFLQAKKYGIGEYDGMLSEGLAFPEISEMGVRHTIPGAEDFGRQKHPVQLDGISYLPCGKEPMDEERCAYRLRRELTERAKEPFYYGWTLGQFLLSGANLSDKEGYMTDWRELRASDYVDPEWIQIYETSGESEKSFYLTSHGMILHSMLECIENDFWGEERMGCGALDVTECEGIRTVQKGGV